MGGPDSPAPAAALEAPLDEAEIEAGRILFAGACDFVAGAARLDQLPAESLPEIAFAGRSNVGKSSLINALTGRKTLARTSNTPGRTQQLNFFDLGGRLMLVDLPGYGYAKVSKSQSKAWTGLLRTYLAGRVGLRLGLILVDARHGLKESDEEMASMLDKAGVAYRIVLTKADKVKPTGLPALTAAVERRLVRHPAAYPTVIATSAEKDIGVAELRGHLARLAEAQ